MADSQEQAELCGKCGQRKGGSGRLTQWIKVCSCYTVTAEATAESDEATDTKICHVCGKRISSGRAGSFTQWVFRSDTCSCHRSGRPMQKDTTDSDIAKAEDGENLAAGEPELKDNQVSFSADQELDQDHSDGEYYIDRIPVERYRVIRKLGTGAAGTILLCRDLILKKNVAIKSLNALGRESLLAFQQEARATSKLKHPNIVQVIDFGITNSGAPYMVLEYFDGVSLEAYLSEHGALSCGRALEVFGNVLDALIYAHDRKIWHRDIKPSNILIAGLGSDSIDVRLIDFGLAALTLAAKPAGVDAGESTTAGESQHKTIAGTPAFMSPDQAMGRSYDARSEVYSLGCLLFALLAGRPPFLGKTALETISMHSSAVPPSLLGTMNNTTDQDADLLESLERIAGKCLAKDPNDRYQSVAELKQALSQSESCSLQESATAESADRHESQYGRKASSALLTTRQMLVVGWAIVFISAIAAFLPSLLTADNVAGNVPPAPKLDLLLGDEGTDQGQQGDMILNVHGHTWYAFVDGNSKRVLRNIKRRKDVPNLWLSTTVDDALIKYISRLKLEGLAFDDSTFVNQNSAVASIAKMKSIVLLVSLQSNWTDSNLSQLATMQGLKYLAVESDLITDNGISRLKEFPNLRALAISGMTQVTDKTVDIILSLPHLEGLSVAHTSVTSSGAVRLIRSGRFSGLSIGGIPLTTPVLNALKESKIERLSLMRCSIDDQVLKNLASMKELKVCDLRRCRNVGEPVANRLHAMRNEAGLPRFVVFFGENSTAPDWDILIDLSDR